MMESKVQPPQKRSLIRALAIFLYCVVCGVAFYVVLVQVASLVMDLFWFHRPPAHPYFSTYYTQVCLGILISWLCWKLVAFVRRRRPQAY